jgi:hypothetical protein
MRSDGVREFCESSMLTGSHECGQGVCVGRRRIGELVEIAVEESASVILRREEKRLGRAV